VNNIHGKEYTVVDVLVLDCRNLIVLPVCIDERVPHLASVHAIAEYQ
jgi:hypothetical protein